MNPFTSRIRITAVALLAAAVAVPMARSEDEKPTPEMLAKAKLSKAEAQKIALEQVPGAKVKDAELEVEKGILRWSFDLKKHGNKNTIEVGVDAVTGKVVENKEETPADTAKEAAEEKAKEKK